MFKVSPNAYSTFTREVVRILRGCLLSIYNSKEEEFFAEFGNRGRYETQHS